MILKLFDVFVSGLCKVCFVAVNFPSKAVSCSVVLQLGVVIFRSYLRSCCV